jgi:hypothetical protein
LQAATANRPSWFPGSKLPAHLDGTLPGDYGERAAAAAVQEKKQQQQGQQQNSSNCVTQSCGGSCHSVCAVLTGHCLIEPADAHPRQQQQQQQQQDVPQQHQVLHRVPLPS